MKTNRLGLTREAIVLWKQKKRLQSIFPAVTETGIILSFAIPNSRLNTLKDGGYLQPFSHVFLTSLEENNYHHIRQIDGIKVPRRGQQDLKSIAYLAFAGELIYKLFRHADEDRRLFIVLKQFSQAIETKPIPLGVVILGWQVLYLAGFVPSGNEMDSNEVKKSFLKELYRTTGVVLSEAAQEGVKNILRYDWHVETALTVSAKVWTELEVGLFAYSSAQVGEELESIKFLKNIT